MKRWVYDFLHYQTEDHEVVACGLVRLMLGGPDGQVTELNPEGVLLLPAGTDHSILVPALTLLSSERTHQVSMRIFAGQHRARLSFENIATLPFAAKIQYRARLVR
ncbi:hypothetical protein [Pseudomonas trivialis]|uniref:hypothetical protein n=1 Tax=Pseudomonas trivialis TaxID=200450 RepID=UPI001F40A867|nr:hypothetical protein [Pseudomonas trivialis]